MASKSRASSSLLYVVTVIIAQVIEIVQLNDSFWLTPEKIEKHTKLEMKNTGFCFITCFIAIVEKWSILNFISNHSGRTRKSNVYSQWAMVVSVQERMGCGPNSKVTAPSVHQDVQLMRTEGQDILILHAHFVLIQT